MLYHRDEDNETNKRHCQSLVHTICIHVYGKVVKTHYVTKNPLVIRSGSLVLVLWLRVPSVDFIVLSYSQI